MSIIHVPIKFLIRTDHLKVDLYSPLTPKCNNKNKNLTQVRVRLGLKIGLTKRCFGLTKIKSQTYCQSVDRDQNFGTVWS